MKSYALDHPKLPPILLDLFFYLFPEFSYLFVRVLPANGGGAAAVARRAVGELQPWSLAHQAASGHAIQWTHGPQAHGQDAGGPRGCQQHQAQGHTMVEVEAERAQTPSA